MNKSYNLSPSKSTIFPSNLGLFFMWVYFGVLQQVSWSMHQIFAIIYKMLMVKVSYQEIMFLFLIRIISFQNGFKNLKRGTAYLGRKRNIAQVLTFPSNSIYSEKSCRLRKLVHVRSCALVYFYLYSFQQWLSSFFPNYFGFAIPISLSKS